MAVSKKTAAAAKSTSKQDVAGRRIAKKGEPKHALYVEKAIPSRMQEFADWLTAETGYEVDARSVYLGSSLRGTFQKSEENQERIAQRAAELEQEKLDRAARAEERAAARVAREEARAARAAEAKETKAAAAKAPAKTAARKAPAKATATKAPAKGKAAPATTRRRPAKTSKVEEDF